MRLFFSFLLILVTPLSGEHFLTFIIPCYNCEEWLEEAVESIYDQRLNCPFEIVCTDDGSTDNTYPLLLSLQERHPQMIVLRHEINQGGSAARNTCVAASRGDIIFCLDSDNVLVKDSIQILIDKMDETGKEIVCFGAQQYFINHFEKGECITYKTETGLYTFPDLFKDTHIPAWSGNYLYTRKSFDKAGGYPPHLGADTWGFGFLQLLHRAEILYVPDTFYWHRHGIESYYIRERKAGRLDKQLFEFLLTYRELFTSNSVKILEQEIDKIERNLPFNNHVYLFSRRKIRLKEEVLKTYQSSFP